MGSPCELGQPTKARLCKRRCAPAHCDLLTRWTPKSVRLLLPTEAKPSTIVRDSLKMPAAPKLPQPHPHSCQKGHCNSVRQAPPTRGQLPTNRQAASNEGNMSLLAGTTEPTPPARQRDAHVALRGLRVRGFVFQRICNWRQLRSSFHLILIVQRNGSHPRLERKTMPTN